jgi:hypothetical protein
MSMSSSTYEVEYIVRTLGTKQWIWLMNALEEPNMPVTNVAIFCDNMVSFDITYNYKIGNRPKYFDVANQLVCVNIDSGLLSLL